MNIRHTQGSRDCCRTDMATVVPVVGAIRRMTDNGHEYYNQLIDNKVSHQAATRRSIVEKDHGSFNQLIAKKNARVGVTKNGQLKYPKTIYHTECVYPRERRMVRYEGHPWDEKEVYPYLWTDTKNFDIAQRRPCFDVRFAETIIFYVMT